METRMVKKGGGTKRKIDKLEKITKREYRATAFTKRCSGLYSKAAQLCLLADAQIAILATPPSSQSNVSFFSFGHTSVDAVVNAYLTGQRLAPVREEPMEEDIGILMARKELGLELWWEKESLCKSKDPRELMDAMKATERMLTKLRSGDFFVSDHEDVKSDAVSQQGTRDVDETLNLQADFCCVSGDDEGVEDEALVFQNNAWDEASTDVSTVNPYLIYHLEGVLEEEAFVFQSRALDEDNLQFSDYFN